ncbi:hypothetical protein [Paenibacillus sp.]|uniref:hypothetical protein n=1 Tax=Paenibacillus sp. TaxID=58172 RepID=UPI002D63838A|nr:hypothetical protein [Paenibacillus sp.]HZG87393.1 hypothetical protein [Paenibacillus sp.]
MQVLMLDDRYEVRTEDALSELFEILDRKMKEADLLISHMTVDGVEIYDDHYDVLASKLNSIKEVIVEVRTRGQLIEDMIHSSEEYIQRALPEVKDLADAFYRNDMAGWAKLEQLFEGMQWLTQLSEALREVSSGGGPTSGDMHQLLSDFQPQWKEMVEAVEQGDKALVGDLLTYEVVPLLERLLIQAKTLKTSRGN